MRLVVDPWDPSYGISDQQSGDVDEGEAVVDVEFSPDDWHTIDAVPGLFEPVVFVDGVRRVDARVWVDDFPGMAASWAAGAVLCDDRPARLGPVMVDRAVFSGLADLFPINARHGHWRACVTESPAPDKLTLALQHAMAATETAVAREAVELSGGELVVVDGPLKGRDHEADVLGLVKTHHRSYLAGAQAAVLVALQPGERTPVFLTGLNFPRHSWYLRLPGPSGGVMTGVVRIEASASLTPQQAIGLAVKSAAVLPRFASQPHKDSRAPQNLFPIAGLERQLRHRLGDARLLYRSLRDAANSLEDVKKASGFGAATRFDYGG